MAMQQHLLNYFKYGSAGPSSQITFMGKEGKSRHQLRRTNKEKYPQFSHQMKDILEGKECELPISQSQQREFFTGKPQQIILPAGRLMHITSDGEMSISEDGEYQEYLASNDRWRKTKT